MVFSDAGCFPTEQQQHRSLSRAWASGELRKFADASAGGDYAVGDGRLVDYHQGSLFTM
jgi:hypothetical protein